MSEELRFDATDRPAAGTACAQCRTGGHFCPAKGYRGEDALCLACGAGEPCEQAGAVLRMERGGHWDEMQVDERGLPGECRQVAITDADRAADTQTGPASAWTIKAELSAANLVKMRRVRPGRVAVPAGMLRVKTAKQLNRERLNALKRERRLDDERRAGRRRRMEELKREGVVGDAAALAAGVTGLCTKSAGCDRPSGHTGRHRGQRTEQKPMAKVNTLALKAPKPSKIAVLPPAPVEAAAPELLTVRLPAAALDKLFLLLQPQHKVAAIERVMTELASA